MIEGGPDTSTRERVLDVALDLFLGRGYERTALREIAERMGFSKAALYYHFASKADLLLALHLRLHRVMDDALRELGEGPVTVAAWQRFLDRSIDELQGNRRLFALHQSERQAMSELHARGHGEGHIELEERLSGLLSDPGRPAAERVRMAAAFAAAYTTPMIVDDAELGAGLRTVVHDILRPRRARSLAPSS